MGFQPYDTRIYKFDREDNARVLYDYLLEIENIEHMSKKSEVGFYAITVEQIVKSEKCKLNSVSQIRTAFKKLINSNILIKTQIGNKRYKQPSIFYMTEIVNRLRSKKNKKNNDNKNDNKNDNSKSQLKDKPKLRSNNTLHKGDIIKIANLISNRNNNKNDSLIIDLANRLINKKSLIDKGIEKDKNKLTFRQELELFGKGSKFKNDECYFDDKEDIYK